MTQTTLSVSVDGWVRSDSATYSTARNSYVAGTTGAGTDPNLGGQRLNAGTYNYFEDFIRFDMSSIATTAAVTAVTFKVKTSAGTGDNIDVVLLGYDCGASVTSADFRTPAELAALTEYGRLTGQTITTDTEYTITLNAAGIAAAQTAVAGAGFLGFMWVSQNQLDGTAPTGDERFTVYSQENATDGNRPKLIVDHVSRPILTTHYLNQMAG